MPSAVVEWASTIWGFVHTDFKPVNPDALLAISKYVLLVCLEMSPLQPIYESLKPQESEPLIWHGTALFDSSQ